MISYFTRKYEFLFYKKIWFLIFQEYIFNLKSIAASVPSGLPTFSVPDFGVTKDNTTYTFKDMVTTLGSGIAVVPFVAILGNVAIAKAFGKY